MKSHEEFPRLEKAFTEMPPEFADAVEAAFLKGEVEMKKRHKLIISLSAVAACLAVFALSALALGNLAAPKPDVVTTRPPVASAAPVPRPDASDPNEPQPAALWTVDGAAYFHADPACSGMRDARKIDLESALESGRKACPICAPEYMGTGFVEPTPEPESSDLVWATLYGSYYHTDPECSGMTGAWRIDSDGARALGMTACPVCAGGFTEDATFPVPTPVSTVAPYITPMPTPVSTVVLDTTPLPTHETPNPTQAPLNEITPVPTPIPMDMAVFPSVWMTEDGRCFHMDEYCSGMRGAWSVPISEAVRIGKAACPICCADRPWLLPMPSEADDTVLVGDGRYYHTDLLCGLLDQVEITTLFTAMSESRLPCPLCTSTDEPPETVYVMEDRGPYHGTPNCAAISPDEALDEISRDEAMLKDLPRCPVCQPGAPDEAWMFKLAFGQLFSDLLPDYRYSHAEPYEENGVLAGVLPDDTDAFLWHFTNESGENPPVTLLATIPGAEQDSAGSGKLCIDGLARLSVSELTHFLAKIPQPLAWMYWDDAQEVIASDDALKGATLDRVIITFANGKIATCDMRFLSQTHYLDIQWAQYDDEYQQSGGGMGRIEAMDQSFDGIIWKW